MNYLRVRRWPDGKYHIEGRWPIFSPVWIEAVLSENWATGHGYSYTYDDYESAERTRAEAEADGQWSVWYGKNAAWLVFLMLALGCASAEIGNWLMGWGRWAAQ